MGKITFSLLLFASFVVHSETTTVSVGFENGLLGEYSNNAHQPINVNTFSTLGITSAIISQESDNGQFGGTQGNDYAVDVTFLFDDGTTVTFDGAVNWRDTKGSTIHGFGIITESVVDDGTDYVASSGYEVSYLMQSISSDFVYEDYGSISGGNAAQSGLLDALNEYLAYVSENPGTEPSSLGTTISSSETEISADGASTSTITVQLKDINGNDLTDGGHTVTLTTDAGTLSSVTDNGDGTYTATLTSSASVETATISGTLNDETILDTESVSFVKANTDPVADDQSVSLDENTSLAIMLTGSDSDDDTLSYIVVTNPENGVLSGTAPNLTYTPDTNFSGADSFTFSVNDGTVDSSTATVSITVNNVVVINNAPVAVADSYSVTEGGTLNGTSVLSNDTDAESDSLTAVQVSSPANGSLTLNRDGTFTYVHDGGETTSDSFTYQANDGSSNSNTVTVTISITAENDAPVAVADSYSVTEGGTLNGTSVLSNDTDAESDSLSAIQISSPANGSLTLNRDGTFTYVHDGGETTSDSFTYQANDGSSNSNTVTVSISITADNDAPVAVADSYSVTEGGTLNGTSVLSNDTDAESDSLSAIQISSPANGSLTLNRDGTFTYVHDGGETTSDSFTYQANDGSSNSNTVTVTISITAENDAPVAVADSYSVTEGGTLNGTSVLSNDTDAESDSLSAIQISSPANGSLTLNSDGTFTYVHDGGETTSDSFTYQANDGSSTSNTVTVSISITADNDAP
ncbi:tandem-95 repeat protein, partial [Alteromonas aestuariivivens]